MSAWTMSTCSMSTRTRSTRTSSSEPPLGDGEAGGGPGGAQRGLGSPPVPVGCRRQSHPGRAPRPRASGRHPRPSHGRGGTRAGPAARWPPTRRPLPVLAETVHELARQLGEVQERAARAEADAEELRQRLADAEQRRGPNRSPRALSRRMGADRGPGTPSGTWRVWLAANRQYLRTLPGAAAREAAGARLAGGRPVGVRPADRAPGDAGAEPRLTHRDGRLGRRGGGDPRREPQQVRGRPRDRRDLARPPALHRHHATPPTTASSPHAGRGRRPARRAGAARRAHVPGLSRPGAGIGVFWMEDEKGADAKLSACR